MGPQGGMPSGVRNGFRTDLGAANGWRREYYRLIETALGALGIAWSEHGVSRLQLPETDAIATEKRLRIGTHFSAIWAGVAETPVSIIKTISDLQRYLAGEKIDFSAVPLDLGNIGAFHRRVYEAARTIAWGETTSYRDLADRAGSPGAARAVGQALSQNPVAIIIPCHRILASNGRLGGFSAHGGIDAKQQLLTLEGMRLAVPRSPAR